MRKWVVIGRHKWVSDASITEMYSTQNSRIRRFVATVSGWNNFKIYEGDPKNITTDEIINRVIEIKQRISDGDENVFTDNVQIE